MVYIPADIVSSILRCVPAESLLRFKLVCKQWLSMINTDPLLNKVDMLFIMTHFRDKKSGFNYSYQSYVIPLCSLSSSSKTIHAKKINNPCETSLHTLSSSCHGFLLCQVRNGNCAMWTMWNPFSGEQVDVPQVFEISDQLGLGYCVKTNDYKVVRIYKDYYFNRKRTSIYSVKSRAWHHIEDFPSGLARQGVFANGLLYFLAGKRGEKFEVAVSLDLSTETYRKLPLPNCMDGVAIKELFSLDGRLFLTNRRFDHFDIFWDLWILQENGKWEKLITMAVRSCTTRLYITPIAYLKSKEQIVVSSGDRFAWFDLKNNKCIKEVAIEGGFVAHPWSVSLDWCSRNRVNKNHEELEFDTAERPWCFSFSKVELFQGGEVDDK